MSHIGAIILAAGKGTRMKSDIPKVLHSILEKPILTRVLETIKRVGVEDVCLVLGGEISAFDAISSQFPKVRICEQKNRLGTGDAVAATAVVIDGAARPSYSAGRLVRGDALNCTHLLIAAGDVPALRDDTLQQFMDAALLENADLAVLGMIHPQPQGYGRLVTDDAGKFLKIVEEKDTNDAQKKIQLCNSGIIFGKTSAIFECLTKVTNENAAKEYYLTDCFEVARTLDKKIMVHASENYQEFDGINTPEQLQALADYMRQAGGY